MNRSHLLLLLAAGALCAALAADAAVIAIDAAHGNYHTATGRYAPFAEFARGEGHEVVESKEPFSAKSVAGFDVLVIANALAAENQQRWTLPTPSAFTDAEIDAIHAWVEGGGRLLLIADHMPFPGASAALARRFGVVMKNGFAFGPGGQGTLHFDTDVGTVASFTGQAFTVEAGAEATPLLVLPPGSVQLFPDTAWDFTDTTPRRDAGGMLQGATLMVGDGRVAVFGEAAMFTSQPTRSGEPPVGFDHPEAVGNRAFLKNVIGWLAGDLPAR